jgi:hypothetical protein
LEKIETCQGGMEGKIVKLQPIGVDGKEIYPLVRVVEIDGTGFHAQYIEPIALVVVENGEKYVISITGEDLSSDLWDMVS